MDNKPSKFELIDEKSDELNEIIGKKPRWIIRWGSSFAFIFIILLLVLSYAIEYPDVIDANIIITKSNPPIRLYAKASGNIQLNVQKNDYVSKSDILVVLMNSGESQDLLELSNKLELISDSIIFSRGKLEFENELNIGEFQSFYSRFLENYSQYQLIISFEPNEKEIINLISKKEAVEVIINELNKRINIATSKLRLLEKDFERNQILFEQSAISEKFLEDKESLLIDQKDFIQSLVLDKSNEKKFLTELERELTKVNYLKVDELQKAKQKLANSFAELKSALNRWKHMFTIVAPIDGRISFTNAWTSNQFITEGDEVIAIVPQEGSNYYLGILSMPQKNSGKVKVGQRVNVSLKSFPDHQYGMLVGKVHNIADVSNNEIYQVVVALPHQLRTNYNIDLPMGEEYSGNAEIITEDLKLIERIYNRLTSRLINN